MKSDQFRTRQKIRRNPTAKDSLGADRPDGCDVCGRLLRAYRDSVHLLQQHVRAWNSDVDHHPFKEFQPATDGLLNAVRAANEARECVQRHRQEHAQLGGNRDVQVDVPRVL